MDVCCSVKKLLLEISQNSQENACARVSFLISLLKRRLWHLFFPVNFARFLRTTFFTEHLGWLLLGVEIHRDNQLFSRTVYGRESNNDVYLNSNSLVLDTWKGGTLKTLVERAFIICSTPKLRHVEINHLKYVISYKNNYGLQIKSLIK